MLDGLNVIAATRSDRRAWVARLTGVAEAVPAFLTLPKSLAFVREIGLVQRNCVVVVRFRFIPCYVCFFFLPVHSCADA